VWKEVNVLVRDIVQHTATHCNTLQHTATLLKPHLQPRTEAAGNKFASRRLRREKKLKSLLANQFLLRKSYSPEFWEFWSATLKPSQQKKFSKVSPTLNIEGVMWHDNVSCIESCDVKGSQCTRSWHCATHCNTLTMCHVAWLAIHQCTQYISVSILSHATWQCVMSHDSSLRNHQIGWRDDFWE